MDRIKLLPHWHLTNTQPAFYDLESATAVDMVAKVYGAMRELQTDYNKYVDEINTIITEFVNSTNKDQECFINKINKIVHDYIKMLDDKIKFQDKKIEDSIIYIKNNLQDGIVTILNEMQESGELDEALANSFDNLMVRVNKLENTILQVTYNSENENLIIKKIIEEGEANE